MKGEQRAGQGRNVGTGRGVEKGNREWGTSTEGNWHENGQGTRIESASGR